MSVRFTIGRKSFYHHIGTDYSQEDYEKIRDAKDGDNRFEERRHWDELMEQYEGVIRNINPGHALTLDAIKQALA